MPFPRSPALRNLAGRPSSASSAPRSFLRSGRWQRSGSRRGYASQGTEGGQKSVASDMPWILGSIAVTVPATYFLLNSGSLSNPLSHPLPGDKYHGEHGEEHEEGEDEDNNDEDEKAETAEQAEEESGNDEDEKAAGGDESKDEGDDAAEKKGQDEGTLDNSRRPPGSAKGTGKIVSETPADGTLSGKRTVKGAADGSTPSWDTEFEYESDSNSRVIHRPDAKGGAKRRIESPYGLKQGSGENDDDNLNKKTAVAGNTSKQQYGLSNTDTKHSYDLMDSEHSKKPEGAPDTAKIQGTVDPNRGKPKSD